MFEYKFKYESSVIRKNFIRGFIEFLELGDVSLVRG